VIDAIDADFIDALVRHVVEQIVQEAYGMVVKVETFTAELPCAGCLKLLEYADLIKAKYGDGVEVVKHIGPCEEFNKYGLTVVPAIVLNKGKIKIMGVCPSLQTIKAALKEMRCKTCQ
jgi:hypothetical protein